MVFWGPAEHGEAFGRQASVRLARICGTAARLACGFCLLGGLALAQAPASKRAPVARVKSSGFEVVPWSLTPAPGTAEARLGMRAERQPDDPPPGVENIIVFGTRLKKAPVESELVRHDDPGAEAWQSEAAQPYVPGMGDSCTYKSGCFDKGQPALFDTIPTLFGSH